jgi:Iap family predicted aminopeptidase
MKFRLFNLVLCSAAATVILAAQPKPGRDILIGSAFTGNQSYDLLEQMCDQAGGRLVGSPANERAMAILSQALRRIGFVPATEQFEIAGWIRADDEVMIVNPMQRRLRAVALGNVDQHPAFEARLVFAGQGYTEDYDTLDVRGNISVVISQSTPNRPPPLRYEAIEFAAKKGAKGILFVNDTPGGLTLAGMSNFQGVPSLIPAYSITLEEGQWLVRLLKKSISVTARMTTKSRCEKLQTGNIVASLPGRIKSKIVLGAHFDSWDVSQGAIDNGIGSGILFDVARILKTYSPQNYYSLEFVWFNGEETGLWGSKDYVKRHKNDDIAAMINMDMTGSPTGINAMGFDAAVPFLTDLVKKLNGFELRNGISSIPGTNSDHEPFMLQGYPTFSVDGYLDENRVKYYHDFADTFDKVSKTYLSEAAAVVSVLASELANNREIVYRKRTERETIDLMKKFKLDERLKKQKEWIFKDE